MKIKWNFFFAAAFFAGWALVANGVPLGPVIAGICAVAALNFWKTRQSRSHR